MCLLLGYISQNLSAHYRCQWVASSQEMLSSYTSDEELFCRRLVTWDKLWIYHWDPLNKMKFMQWKNVDCLTFTSMCKSAINCMVRLCGLLMTDYLHPGNTTAGQYYAWPTFKLLDVTKQKHRRKLSLSSFTFSWQCTGAQVIGCSASSRQLRICSIKPSCLQSRLDSR